MCFGTCGGCQAFAARGPVRSAPLDAAQWARVLELRTAHAEQIAERERVIADLCRRAVEKGELADPAYWTMVYDFEMAPTTNGRTMLMRVGVVPLPPQELPDATALHEALWTVIEALAANSVYLLNTDHLTDQRVAASELYLRRSWMNPHCLPPGGNASEHIDVLHDLDIRAGGKGAEPERLLAAGKHPVGSRVTTHRAPPQSGRHLRPRPLPPPLKLVPGTGVPTF